MENVESVYPLTPTQKGILHHVLYAEKTAAYQLQFGLDIEGQLDSTILLRALEHVVSRHGALRCMVLHDGLDEPAIVVRNTVKIPWQEIDLTTIDKPARRSKLDEIATDLRCKPIELNTAPLYRATLVKLDERKSHILLDIHHIVFDGWSYQILLTEWVNTYLTLGKGAEPQLSKPGQFSDYAGYLQSVRHEGKGRLVSETLDSCTVASSFPVTGAPDVEPSVKVKGSDGSLSDGVHIDWIPMPLVDQLEAQAAKAQTTLNALFNAAWGLLLSRYLNRDAVIFGVANHGRVAVFEQHKNTIGLFVSTLPLCVDCKSDRLLRDCLVDIHSSLHVLADHEYVSLGELSSEMNLPAGTSLFETLLVFQKFPSEALQSDPNLRFANPVSHESSPMPLTLEIFEGREVALQWIYRSSLLSESALKQIGRHYKYLLEQLASANLESTKLTDIQLLPSSDRQQIRKLASNLANPESNNADGNFPVKRIEEVFLDRCAATPDALAIIDSDGNNRLSYSELLLRAKELESTLARAGIGEGDVVAVDLPRSCELYTALLGVLLRKGVFVMLESSLAEERLKYILFDSCSKALICNHKSTLVSDESITLTKLILDPRGLSTTIVSDDPKSIPSQNYTDEKDRDSKTLTLPADSCYLMYTSGSSGKPKAVIGTHRATLNRFEWMWKEFPFQAEEISCQRASVTFVDSIWEIFGPLLQGAPVNIASKDASQAPAELTRFLGVHNISRLHIVPTILQLLLDELEHNAKSLPDLRFCFVSGEPLNASLAARLFKLLPDCRLINLYGSTEVSADVTVAEITREMLGIKTYQPLSSNSVGSESSTRDGVNTGKAQSNQFSSVVPEIPIGRAIDGCSVFVLDRNLNLMPPGAIGEICVTGAGVSAGYLRDDVGRDDAFTDNPFGTGKLFRTGDLGYYTTQGVIYCRGRMDTQINLAGVRIELTGIEAHALDYANVEQAVARVNYNQLELWYATSNKTPLTEAKLRDHLGRYLLPASIPARFIHQDSLPRTASGKTDRAAVAEMLLPVVSAESHSSEPVTPTQQKLADYWRDLLHKNSSGPDDHFVDSGGDSLSALKLNALLKREFGTTIPPRILFTATLGQLAAYLDAKQQATGSTGAVASSSAVVEAAQKAVPYQHHRDPADEQQTRAANDPQISDREYAAKVTNRRRQDTADDTNKSAIAAARLPASMPAYFQSSGGQLLGIYHRPNPERVTTWRTPLLICSSLGHEYMVAHAMLRMLSVRLANQGIPVLRFDYSGHGDSSGELQDCSLSRWQDDIKHAALRLRHLCGTESIDVLGVRIGALLATSANPDNVRQRYAWDPLDSGRSFVEHLDSLHRYAIKDLDRYATRQLGSDPHERYGYLYGSSLLNELTELTGQAMPGNSDYRETYNRTLVSTGFGQSHSQSAEADSTTEILAERNIWGNFALAQYPIFDPAVLGALTRMVTDYRGGEQPLPSNLVI